MFENPTHKTGVSAMNSKRHSTKKNIDIPEKIISMISNN